MKRWKVVVCYKKEIEDAIFEIEELSELHDRIEQGRDWTTIDTITVVYQR